MNNREWKEWAVRVLKDTHFMISALSNPSAPERPTTEQVDNLVTAITALILIDYGKTHHKSALTYEEVAKALDVADEDLEYFLEKIKEGATEGDF